MIAYLLDVSLCWLIFYLLYYFWLSKETFFHLNRWYLLGTLLLGLIIPVIPSPFGAQVQESDWVTLYVAPISMGLESLEVTVTAPGTGGQDFDWLALLKWIYWGGVAFTGFRFLSGLWRIGNMYRKAEHIRIGQYRVALTNEYHLPFSFFRVVFKSKLGKLNDFEEEKITDHELAHVRGWHTIDVLMVELVSIFLWCSPPVHLYRRSLRIVHEYIADSAAIRTGQKKKYGHLLIRQSQSGLQLALANNFIQSQLKKRIMMMTKTRSRRQAFLKYLPVIPLLVVALIAFSNWEAVAGDRSDLLNIDALNNLETLAVDEYDPRVLRKQLSAALHKLEQLEDNEKGNKLSSFLLQKFVNVHQEWTATYPDHLKEIRQIAEEVATTYKVDLEFGKDQIKTAYLKSRSVIYSPGMDLGTPPLEGIQIRPEGEPYVLINDKPAPADWKATLDKENIKSVEVLKGESATEAFGDKAKDGAILITTKDFKKAAVEKTESVKEAPSAKVIISKLENAQAQPLYILDGQVVANDALGKLNPDDIEKIDVLKGEQAEKEYGERGTNGVVRIFTKARLYDKSPIFPGCEDLEGADQVKCSKENFLRSVYMNILYPASAREKNIEGMIVVKYTIGKDGKVEDANILRGIDQELDNEVLRVINDLPDWSPATKNGEPVATEMILPVRFRIENDAPISEEAKQAMRAASQQEKKAVIDKPSVKGKVVDEIVVTGYGNPPAIRKEALIVEEMPRFPGCEEESLEDRTACSQKQMLAFVYNNITYPKAAKEAGTSGTVLASFVVSKDGSIRDVRIEKGRGHGLNEQVLEAIQKMPKWIPGRQDGKAVDAVVHLPVKFKLDTKKEKPTVDRVDEVRKPSAGARLKLQNFRAAPNPSNGLINLRFQSEAQPLNIRILTANGQVVYQRELPQFGGNFDEQIDLQDAPKGTLFISVQQGEKIHTSTVILQ